MQRPTRTVEVLPCILTDDEVLEKSKSQQSILQKIDDLEQEAKGVSKRYKSEVETCKAEVARLRDQISTGKEYKDVECMIQYDFDVKKEKIYIRKDTGEIVRMVPLTERELQEELDLENER